MVSLLLLVVQVIVRLLLRTEQRDHVLTSGEGSVSKLVLMMRHVGQANL